MAHLEQVKGAVTLTRGETQAPARAGYLFSQDALETGADGEARVRFARRVVEIGHDARLVITEDASGLVVKVARGLVLTRVAAEAGAAAAPGVSLSILTPFGLTRLGDDGAEVSVDVGEESGRVKVKVGTVEFVQDGQSTRAGPGDQLSLTLGKVERVGEPATLELPPIQVVLTAQGRVELKSHGAKQWRKASPTPTSVAEGDQVRVSQGQAELSLDASPSRFTLGKGAELALGSVRRVEGISTASFDLKRGELVLALAPDQKSAVEIGGFTLQSDLGGYFFLVRTGAGFEVSAVTGDLSVVRPEHEAVAVRAGQVARLSNQDASVGELDIEPVVLPTHKGLRVFHPGIDSATLAWEGEDHDYLVEVAADPAFAQMLFTGKVHHPRVNVRVPARGALHWRVRERPEGEPLAAGSATFGPEAARNDLGRLRNEVPEGSEKTTIYFQDKPPAVTFVYDPEPNAQKYRLRVFRADDLERPLLEKWVREDRVALEAGVLTEGSYVWSIAPLAADGEELRGGKMTKLDIVYDNAVPSLMVLAPRNGEVLNGTSVAVSGIAPVGARLSINGRAAPLDDKSRFATTTSPIGRPPAVIFKVSQARGGEVMVIRVLRRGR